LIVLLSTGQLPSAFVAQGTSGQARFVGGYLAKEMVANWFGSDSTERGENIFDRVTFETGREISKNGVESVLVELELSPHLAVQAQRDAYEAYNLGSVVRFRFRCRAHRWSRPRGAAGSHCCCSASARPAACSTR